MTAAWLAALAQAGTEDAWNAMGDGELLEALGEEPAAAQIYRQLSRQLGSDDSSHAEALYRLGRVLLRLGQVEEATRALDECVRSPGWHARCLAERTEVEILRSSVRALPTTWTFDDTAHGLIHPWTTERGTIRIGLPPGERNPALLWTDDPRRGETDRLIIGFALGNATPERLSFEAWTLGQPGALQVRAEDGDGRQFVSSEPIHLSNRRQSVVLRLASLRDDAGEPLDPNRLHRLSLVDERALSAASGEATIAIDRFEVW